LSLVPRRNEVQESFAKQPCQNYKTQRNA
jgi:hypothetical protein